MSERWALLVDDDPSWRDILSELLEDSGFLVDVAATLSEAQQLVRARAHKVAVVDLSLEATDHRNHDGLTVLRHLKARDPRCQAILLTGHATVELAVQVITEKQAITCLQKELFSRAEFRRLLDKTSLSAPLTLPDVGASKAPASHGLALVVDDDAGWRELLTELLEECGLSSTACGSFADARSYLELESYQLAVVDLQLSSSVDPSNKDGLKLLGHTRKAGIPTIIVSGTGSIDVIERTLEERTAVAFFEKQDFSRKAFCRTVESNLTPNALDVLTEREREVLDLLAEGLTNSQIADKLFISANTVKRHLKSVFEKLDVNNRAAAAALVVREGSSGPGDL
jgi:DNA-binding NarL/FixJ family response regulator